MPQLNQVKNVLESTLAQPVHVAGANDAFRELLLLTAIPTTQQIIIVAPTAKEMSQWGHFLTHNETILSSLKASWSFLPALSPFGTDRFINQSQFKWQRLMSLSYLSDATTETRTIIVTHPAAILQRTYSAERFKLLSKRFQAGQDVDLDDAMIALKEMGYREVPTTTEEGQFSLKGSILDIYSPSSEYPYRIEFLGDEIQSIRIFASDTQKSQRIVDHAFIAPAHEYVVPIAERKVAAQRLHDYLSAQSQVFPTDRDGILNSFFSESKSSYLDFFASIIANHQTSVFDYLRDDALVIFPKGLDVTVSKFEEFYKSALANIKDDISLKRPIIAGDRFFGDAIQELQRLNDVRHIDFSSICRADSYSQFQIKGESLVEGRIPSRAETRFDDWMSIVTNKVQLDGSSVILLTTSSEQEERLGTLLSNRDLSSKIDRQILEKIAKGGSKPFHEVRLAQGYLSDYIWVSEEQLLILPEHLLFGVNRPKKASATRRLKNFISSFSDLKVDDLVVYEEHGIGRYMGLITLDLGGTKSDFLHIQYHGTDKIYLPVDRLGSLQRYSSHDGSSHVTLDKLGSGNWEKRKAKVKQAVKEMADKLLRIQAQRALAPSHVYSKPDDDYYQFEAEFPYDETEDQLKAIEEVNHDLESGKQMDRLICGDVGFGKTEVALRAAFRAVHEGYQVLVLVPTTILCYQHYRSFYDRLQRHGIKVAQLNRFITPKISNEYLSGFSEGKIDILIGTHKILSNKLKAKRLGLIVVDEEQRFGVVHKERLKELKANADILTLTATPIPRTLHMSMLGLRDISIIATPPPNRLSVRTFTAKFDEGLIKNAIENEVVRGGQVFFIHNRIEDIQEMALFIKALVPRFEVRIGHGQMKENDLEQVIIDFIEQKFQVLVCTTIIESGVDMPNVNTIIINDADRFGLAQLYQMRGRVGRSSQQAFAYLLTKDPGSLTDEAQKRLEVIATHQSLGSGFQIASHDLEIRGAGNLLGAEQSGHASDVGLEMYTDMLGEAIQELKGQQPDNLKVDAEVKLGVMAMIPKEYIVNEGQRLVFYKQIFSAESLEEIESISHSMVDQFGAQPDELKKLIFVGKIKFVLSSLGANSITVNRPLSQFEIKFSRLTERSLDKIIGLAQKSPGQYRLSPDYRLMIYWNSKSHGVDLVKVDELSMLEHLFQLLYPLFAEVDVR